MPQHRIASRIAAFAAPEMRNGSVATEEVEPG
jgi:hypothetical protein